MKKTVCIWLAVLLLLSACSRSAATWQEQYDLGVRYLSEGKYEEAVIAFNAAIEIDPKRSDAYLGLADAYEAQGDVERARQVLEDALAVAADPDAIRNRLDRLGGSATAGPVTGATAGPTQEPTPESAIIASGECGENLTWTFDSNGLLTISGTGPMENYAVWSNVPWYAYSTKSITEVVIEDGVTSIGDRAFQGGYWLTSVTIPNSVTSIRDFVFSDCTRLTGVTIPDSVTSIGERAFAGCESLTGVTIPNSVASISDGAFLRCESLTSVTIGSGVTSIGNSAFAHCSSLTSVTIPDGVTSIGPIAFNGCNSLTSMTIPDSVTSIGQDAFTRCDSLTDVYYGGSEAQWDQIAIGSWNDLLLSAAIHYNS